MGQCQSERPTETTEKQQETTESLTETTEIQTFTTEHQTVTPGMERNIPPDDNLPIQVTTPDTEEDLLGMTIKML